MNNAYNVKFRPAELSGLIGQETIVRSLKDVLKKGTARCFVLHGPAGVGKTTTARIIATTLGCEDCNRLDIDGATYTGIDKMREITESLRYQPMTKSKTRVVIVDEAHRLSKQAWDSLLKDTEEPPVGVYWIFCTTEPAKIPATIRSRGATYEFKAVSSEKIYDLLLKIAKEEKLTTSEDILYAIAIKSGGSVRISLTALAQCSGCESVADVEELLHIISAEEGEAVELARLLLKGATWAKALTILKKLDEQAPESIRMVILSYLSKVLLNTASEESVMEILFVMACFRSPYYAGEGMAPLLLSLGKVIFV